MPGRNLTRLFVEESYYHIYNRGVNKRKIFLDKEDYTFFTGLFHRYIDQTPTNDSKGRPYRWLGDQVELLSYCLMPNHYHLLVYQEETRAISELLLSLGTAYTMYFNKKYNRRGPLFESAYRASLISSDTYLQHISRYIHLNPKQFRTWPYSSYSAYLAEVIPGGPPGITPSWLHPDRILELFESNKEYKEFVNDYESLKREMDELKGELAGY
jgi:putative transposase